MVLLGGLEFIAAGYFINEAAKHKRARRIQEENDEQRREHAHRRRRHSDQGTNRPHQSHHQILPPLPQQRRSSPDKRSKEQRHDRNDRNDRNDNKKPSGKGDYLPPPILKNPRRNGSAPPPGAYLPEGHLRQGQRQQPQPAMNGGPHYDDPNRYVPSYHYPPPPPLPMSTGPQQSYPAYKPVPPPSYTPISPPQSQPPAMLPSHYVPPPQGVWEMPGGTVMAHPYPAASNGQARPFSPHVHFADLAHSNYEQNTPPPPYREL